MPASRSGGPSPVPIASMCSTPAASARSITASRSASNWSLSRWQCESISITSGALRPERLRGSPPAPACRLRATRPRSCRCDSMPRSLRGCRLATITTLRPTSCFGCVGVGDAGHDACAAAASPMSTCRCSSLSEPFTRSAETTWPTRRSTFSEIVDGDFDGLRSPGGRPRLGLPAPNSAACRAFSSTSSFSHLLDGAFASARGKTAATAPIFWPARSCAPVQIREVTDSNRRRHAELRPDLRGRFGQHGIEQRGDDAQRLRGGVQASRPAVL